MPDKRIEISIAQQRLTLLQGDEALLSFLVSTALNGAGEQEGSGCTPRGKHLIRACIGDGMPEGAVFVGRRFTGEIYSQQLSEQYPKRDWILTRILWLSGCEVGKNRLGGQDTMRRYIYIHGTPDTEPMGAPYSHGCIRMRNHELLQLFESVEPGLPVFIEE